MEITISLRELRSRLGISQRKAAELCGVTHKTWWSWENHWRGMRPRPLAIKVIQFLPHLVAAEHRRQAEEQTAKQEGSAYTLRLLV
jgi:DNA-binding XRE family transcriptional regulator